MKNKVYYGEYSLKHWIDLILSKNIVLPEYQRSFVWNEEKVKRLIKAFQDDLFVPPVTIGAFVKDNKNMNLVLDGQQRLTSILLAYLKVYPKKNIFKNPENAQRIYNSDYDEIEYISDDESEDIIKWTFSEIQKYGDTPSKIRDYIHHDKANQYNNLDITIDDEFLENHYLGFSFLVPDSITMQKNYYANVFREINIGGVNLLAQESREALYYLNDELKEFFDPKFTEKYKIKSNNDYKMDFVRYISIISQYKKEGRSKNIALRTKGKLENYYINYIDAVIQNDDSNRFGKFSDIFPNNNWKSRIENVKKYLGKITAGNTFTFDSIINMDILMFGLIYFVMFENKTLQIDKIEQLKERIKSNIDSFRNDEKHAKSPNSLTYLRERIDSSIEIYQEFIDESA